MKKVCVIGLGYIGLPTSVILGLNNFEVIGVDVNKSVIDKLNKSETHIVEPGLTESLSVVNNKGLFKAQLEPEVADIFMICVPTPFKNHNNDIPEPGLAYVMEATSSISKFLKKGDLIILESTSPVGTTELIEKKLNNLGININEIDIAYCPERVLPGNIMNELIENDRIVGGLSKHSTKVAVDFYKSFVKGSVLDTDANTAEMCKLTENSFRDVNIAFANELSLLCSNLSIDVWELISLANRHPRVNILQPGPGVGGHCISVDPWFIASKDPENSKLIQTARHVNLKKTKWVCLKIKEYYNNLTSERKLKNLNISILGLAFKPNIDDLRESPAIEIALSLLNEGYPINVVEPNIQNHDKFNLLSLDEVIKSNSLKVVLVQHEEFIINKDIISLDKTMVLDFCGLYKI